MGKAIVTYSSIYGSSRSYAVYLASALGIEAVDIKDSKPSSGCILVHFGGLYAGTMSGLRKAVQLLPPDSRLIAVSVGLSDPGKEENINRIDEVMNRMIPAGIRDRVERYHLRGAMDYSRLSKHHRAMMWMLCRSIELRKNRSDEDQQLLDTYGGNIDFIDPKTADPIAVRVRALLS